MIFDPAQRPGWSRYAVAVLAVAAAAAIRAGLLGILGTRAPYVTFYPAVILAALFGGLPGGLLASVLSVLTADFFWVEPVHQFSIRDPADWLSAGVFVAACVMISWVTQAMQRARTRAVEAEAQLRLATERRRAEEALRGWEESYRRLFNSIDEGFCVIEKVEGAAGEPSDFRYVEANPALATQSGVSGVLGRTIRQVIPGESEEWIDIYDTVLRTGKPMRFERGVPTLGRVLELYAFRVEDETPRRVAVLFKDITERKRAEESLRESEARLAFALETTGTGAWDLNPVDHTAHRSLVHERIFGYQSLLPQWTFEIFLEHVLPEDREEVAKKFNHAAETKTDWAFECRIRRTDGQVRWIWVAGRHQLDSAGEVRRMAGVVQDITERKRAEEALRESRDRLALAQQIARAGNFDLDLRADVIVWSEELQKLYGIGPGKPDVKMEDWLGWVVPEDRERVLAEFAAGLKAGEVTLQFRIRPRETDEVRWIEGRGQVLRDKNGAPVRFIGFSIEITEQKRIEQALAEAVQRLNAHMDNSPLAVVEFDPQFRVTRWSREAERLFGWRAEEVLGRAIGELRWVHEDDAEAVLRVSQEMMEGKRPRNLSVNRNYRKDGSVIECEWYNSAIHDAEGRLTSVLSQVLDVTARKQAEERLRHAQKLESLGMLAGGVAHDFNNLLVGVIGNAGLALELLPPDHPAVELLGSVLRTGEQAAHLTRQMLAYSGRGKFVVEPLNLSEVIPEMIGLVRPSISKKITLHLDLKKDLPAVEADRGQMQQVFMNLALNAAEAIGGQDGLITVRTGVEEVDGAYQRLHPETAALGPGKYVYLEVRDTGCGMDEKTRAKIFDPFFSTKFLGRGLGLAAVDGVLRGHKGAIAVTSAPGKGSCFSVLFPATTRAVGKARVRTDAGEIRGAGTVLVVDDERVVREMAKRALERHGYTVLLADSGSAAMDIFKRHPGEIALVVLDLSMPQMGGGETLRELRKIRPGVKAMVTSGYGEAEALAMFEGQRVSGFIQKPYSAIGIAEKVKTSLTS